MGNSLLDSQTVNDDEKEIKKHIQINDPFPSNHNFSSNNSPLCVINNSYKMISGFSGDCAPRSIFPS
jgi:hypothetical protein